MDHLRAVATACRAEKTTVGFESDGRRGETQRGELGGDNAALRRAAGVKWLGHGAEVLPQPAGLACAQAQGATGGFTVEFEQPSGARCRANSSAGGGAVKALLVMSRQDRLRHLALHFDRNLIRRRELAPIDAIPLGERKQLVEQAMRFFAEEQIKMGVFYDVAVTMISNRLHNVLAKRVAWASNTWELR